MIVSLSPSKIHKTALSQNKESFGICDYMKKISKQVFGVLGITFATNTMALIPPHDIYNPSAEIENPIPGISHAPDLTDAIHTSTGFI